MAKSKRLDVVVGIELELEYNRDMMRINRGGYKTGSFALNGFGDFVAEDDGSVHGSKFSNGETVELVGLCFKASRGKDFLKRFHAEVIKRIMAKKRCSKSTALAVPFSEIFNINNTMGAHAHINPILIDNNNDEVSITYLLRDGSVKIKGKKLIMRDVMNNDFITDFRYSLRAAVKKEMPEVFPQWDRNLFRSYAKKIVGSEGILNAKRDRYYEFNLSLSGRSHVEYRCFNLNGVTSWEQFFKIWDVFFKVLKKCAKKNYRVTGGFKEKLELSFSIEPVRKEKLIVNETIRGE
jgi:hypothetical protein